MMTDIRKCFREDFDEWVEKSNLHYNKSNKSLIASHALEEIWEVLRKHPDADYFWYTNNGNLTWTFPSEDPQPVTDGGLRTVSGMAKRLIRDEKLNRLGI